MPAPLVSILIPCYNAAPWLAQTLESALAQSWKPLEIIVVNDGSSDGSRGILRRYEPRGVRVIDQPNAGQSAAFNRAIAAAAGKYLEFLDADDLLAPDKVALQVERLGREPPGTIASGEWGRFQDDPARTDFRPDDLWVDLEPVEWLCRAWVANNMMHGAAYLVPAELVRVAGGWREELTLINDFEFFSRLMLAARKIAFCPGARSHYRSGVAGSLSRSNSEVAWSSAFRSLELGTSRLLAREDSARTRRTCAAVWRVFVHDSYPAVPRLRREAEARVRALGEEVGMPARGPRFQLAARWIGWRAAKRLQRLRARLFTP